eukprot:scaffold7141_cov107-Isochrysis_galbana.AAC.5
MSLSPTSRRSRRGIGELATFFPGRGGRGEVPMCGSPIWGRLCGPCELWRALAGWQAGTTARLKCSCHGAAGPLAADEGTARRNTSGRAAERRQASPTIAAYLGSLEVERAAAALRTP